MCGVVSNTRIRSDSTRHEGAQLSSVHTELSIVTPIDFLGPGHTAERVLARQFERAQRPVLKRSKRRANRHDNSDAHTKRKQHDIGVDTPY